MYDTKPLNTFDDDDLAHAANHCDPATRTTNPECRQLIWLPPGNPGGGLFSTAADLVLYLRYNMDTPPTLCAEPKLCDLYDALPIIHQRDESAPGGGQELGWQTSVLASGEKMTWNNGANGPFLSVIAYQKSPKRGVVLLSNNPAYSGQKLLSAAQTILMSAP